MTTHVLVPCYGLALILVASFGPDRLDRAAAALFAFGMAVLAAERMARLDRVPFTDNREEDRGLELGNLMAGAMVLGILGTAFGAALPSLARWPVALATLALAAVRIRRRVTPNPALTLASTEKVYQANQIDTDNPADDSEQVPPVTPPTIARELRAVAVLFVVLCVLPWLAGAVFAS